jgi:voltage-gated potassium channel
VEFCAIDQYDGQAESRLTLIDTTSTRLGTDGMPKDKSRGTTGIYELLMLGLCAYVLMALAAMTLFRLDESVIHILEYVDAGVCVLFLTDFCIQYARAESKLRYLRWGWIDLVSSIPTWGWLRWGRLARVVRILRLLRGVKSVKTFAEVLSARRADSAVAVAAFVAVLTVVFASVVVLHFEQDNPAANIRTAEDALWWACVTITTAGYGDRYPVTTEGRIAAVIAMTIGVGLFGTFTAFVAQWFIQPGEYRQEDQLQALRGTLARIEKQLSELNLKE